MVALLVSMFKLAAQQAVGAGGAKPKEVVDLRERRRMRRRSTP